MAKQEIVTYGHPSLRTKSENVCEITDEIKEIIRNLEDTLNLDSGIGLAAPQIGANKQIFLVDLSRAKDKRRVILLNPKIISQSNETDEYEEGCLSLPEIWGNVTRPSQVKVKGQLLNGSSIIIEADGLFARALQHELDHLQGKLFIDYLSPDEYEKNRVKIQALLDKNKKNLGKVIE
jgi:peptide deformylase